MTQPNMSNHGEVEMAKNRKLIREQNLAAKSGKYISLAEAANRLTKRLEDEKEQKLKGKK